MRDGRGRGTSASWKKIILSEKGRATGGEEQALRKPFAIREKMPNISEKRGRHNLKNHFIQSPDAAPDMTSGAKESPTVPKERRRQFGRKSRSARKDATESGWAGEKSSVGAGKSVRTQKQQNIKKTSIQGGERHAPAREERIWKKREKRWGIVLLQEKEPKKKAIIISISRKGSRHSRRGGMRGLGQRKGSNDKKSTKRNSFGGPQNSRIKKPGVLSNKVSLDKIGPPELHWRITAGQIGPKRKKKGKKHPEKACAF